MVVSCNLLLLAGDGAEAEAKSYPRLVSWSMLDKPDSRSNQFRRPHRVPLSSSRLVLFKSHLSRR